VAEGNPSDSEKFTELLVRVRDVFGRYSAHGGFDGGFAPLENLEYAKEVLVCRELIDAEQLDFQVAFGAQ
jgi:hypothetical protein